MRAALLALLAVGAAGLAPAAQDEPAWPPPEGIEARMRALQAEIRSPDATTAQREAARAALGRLLMSPEATARGATAAGTKAHPLRAAIEPSPAVVRPLPPLPAPPPPAPGVAHVEVTQPAPPVVNPQTGTPLVPSGRFAVDPATGSVLHPVPGGYIDPRTGQFVPAAR